MPMRLGYLYSRYPVISQTFPETLKCWRWSGAAWTWKSAPYIRHSRALGTGHRASCAQKFTTRRRRGLSERWRSSPVVTAFSPPVSSRTRGAIRPGLQGRATRAQRAFFRRTACSWWRGTFSRAFRQERSARTALFVKAISKVGFSFTAHAQDFMVDVGSDELLREMCREAAFVVTVSDYSRQLLSPRSVPTPKEKFTASTTALICESSKKARPTKIADKLPRILSIGRLIQLKGFRDLIAACAELKKRAIQFECEIIGEGPLRGPQLQDAISTSLDQTAWWAVGSTTPGGSCEAWAIAMSLLSRASSIAKVRATFYRQLFSKPWLPRGGYVSTRLAHCSRMIPRDGESGLLVAPGDVKGLANALELLLRDPQLRARFGAAGRRNVEVRFDVDKTAAQLLEVVEAAAVPRGPVSRPRESGFAALPPSRLGMAEPQIAGA